MNTVNKPFRKKDAMQLVTGQPVYMDDLVPADCLIVKLLRSPHANAIVKSINTAVAKKVPGIEAVFTWEDVPQDARRYTQAGQTYPEASPYDRLLIDRHVHFVGDVVAIVAGKDDECVDKALKMIKVEYEVLEPVLDYHTAKDNPILVHPEDNWESLCPVGGDNKRNLCAHDECGSGDIDAVLADCDVVIDHVYHTKACQQAMMETFRTYCSIDLYGRLNVLSSTQIVFHARRIIANALHIPKSMVRVTKPRIAMRWRFIFASAQTRMAASGASTSTPSPTPALMASTAPRRWAFRDINPSRSIAALRLSALPMMWSIPTICRRAHTAATARPRACSRWNPLSTSWPRSSIWTPSGSGK